MILEHGPLKKFAMLLGEIRAKFTDNCPIRTYLVTARSAASSGLRALRVFCFIICSVYISFKGFVQTFLCYTEIVFKTLIQ